MEEERPITRLDEEVIEAAFWHFDAERRRSGAERDAFKRQVRLVTEAHIRSVLRALTQVDVTK